MRSTPILLASFLGFALTSLAWTIPNIELPTFTYQCMPIELSWRDGSPPYTVWFQSADEPTWLAPKSGFGAWYNLTGTNYLVPCKASTGSTLSLTLKDSTGWISTSPGSFVVLPSSDSSCLEESNNTGLVRSQSVLSSILTSFQQSVVSAISVSATAVTAVTTSLDSSEKPNESSAATAVSSPGSVEKEGINLGRILGPVLGCFFGILIGIALSVCYIRRQRKKTQPEMDPHIPLSSVSAFDLLEGEQVHRPEFGSQETRVRNEPASTSTAVPTTANTPVTSIGRLQVHDGTTLQRLRSEKRQPGATPPQSNYPRDPPLNEGTGRAATSNESQSQPPQPPLTRDQNLEQRAEELSAPELERLAALVARRLERVRGAPPQYQATDDI